MYLKVTFTIYIFLFAVSTCVYSELPSSPKPTPEFIKSLSLIDRRVYETTIVEFELLMQRKLRGLNDELRSQLTFSLERLVTNTCMSSLSDKLKYEGPPTGQDCNDYLELLKKLFPASPVVACAEHGISSQSCVESYQKQYISTEKIEIKSDKFANLDYTVKLRTGLGAKLERSDSISQLQKQYQDSPTFENKQELLKLYDKELNKNCEEVYLKLLEKEPPIEWQAGYVEVIRKDDPLVKMIKEFAGETDEKSKPEKNQAIVLSPSNTDYQVFRKEKSESEDAPTKDLWRVRYLSSACLATIKQALESEPDFYPAVCIREGYEAPRCIEAKISFRQKQKAAHASKSEGDTKPSTREPLFTTF